MNIQINRRNFLKSAGLCAAVSCTWNSTPKMEAALTKTASDPFFGLKIGVASYSLRKFPLEKALEMTSQMGVKYITLKEMHLPYTSTLEQLKAAQEKVKKAGLVLMGGGVIYTNNQEKDIRALFQYAKDAGMSTMVACPEPASLDIVEKLAKEFDIRVAIHNHGPGDKKYPSPIDVLNMVKDRGAHMGICMDLGHTVRLGQDPLPVMEQCARRLYDFHIKDVTKAEKDGANIEAGMGVIDLVAVLRFLKKIKFNDHVALEYEIKADNPFTGMVESFAYMRGVLAALV